MKPSIDEALVRHIAHLARLKLTDEEVSTFGGQLRGIVGFIETLSELNTDDIEPTAHPLSVTNVFRPDAAQPSLSTTKVLSNAPDAAPPYFQVPKVLDQMDA